LAEDTVPVDIGSNIGDGDPEARKRSLHLSNPRSRNKRDETKTGLFDGGGVTHELRALGRLHGRRSEIGGVACASSNEKDAWALKKERDPGRGREKAKQEKN
jgi:hypothetical protein